MDTVFVRYDTSEFDHALRYKTDTLIFDNFLSRLIMIGTTVIPISYNRNTIEVFGIGLDNISKSACLEELDFDMEFQDRVNSILKTDTSLIVDINIASDCCVEFLGDASTDTSGVLNLIYIPYGPTCFCDVCCIGLTYEFSVLFDKKWDWIDFPKIKAIMINGNPETRRSIN